MKKILLISIMLITSAQAQIIGDAIVSNNKYLINKKFTECAYEKKEVYNAYFSMTKPKKEKVSSFKQYSDKEVKKVVKYLNKTAKSYIKNSIKEAIKKEDCKTCKEDEVFENIDLNLFIFSLEELLKCTKTSKNKDNNEDIERLEIYIKALKLKGKSK